MKKRIGLCVSLLGMFFALIICALAGERYSYTGNWAVSEGEPVFCIRDRRLETAIRLFDKEENGISYLFLPAYSAAENVFLELNGADYAKFDDGADEIEIKDGKPLSSLREDTVYACTVFKDGAVCRNLQFCMMHSKNLPTIYIGTETGTMGWIDADKSYREPGDFLLVDCDGNVACVSDLKYITGRGNDTWRKPKKSYGVRLSVSADLLGMGAADHWILLCNVTDDAYIRNKITYDMAIAAGMEGAPESAFVDLYVNGVYHGLYQLAEKVEIDPERIPIKNLDWENDKVNENYNEAACFEDETKKGVLLDKEPSDITGGYLIERDVYSKYVEEVSGFQSSTSKEYYTIKSPGRASRKETAYIQNLFSEMEAAVRAPDGINPETGKSFLEYIDLTSFVKKYMIEELCKNNGGGASSSFFYKPSDVVSNKIFAGPVWDYDKAYAQMDSYNANPRDLEYMTQRLEGTTLFRELNKHVEFKEAVAACYAEFFSDYMQKICDEKVDACYERIKPAAAMDRVRWSKTGSGEEEQRACEESLQTFKEFVRERKAFLDEVWIEGKEICVVTFREASNQVETSMGVIKGEKVTPVRPEDIWSMPEGWELEGWYDVETGERFDESLPVERDMVLEGRLRESDDST